MKKKLFDDTQMYIHTPITYTVSSTGCKQVWEVGLGQGKNAYTYNANVDGQLSHEIQRSKAADVVMSMSTHIQRTSVTTVPMEV